MGQCTRQGIVIGQNAILCDSPLTNWTLLSPISFTYYLRFPLKMLRTRDVLFDDNRDLKQTTMATAMRTWRNKRSNKQNNSKLVRFKTLYIF